MIFLGSRLIAISGKYQLISFYNNTLKLIIIISILISIEIIGYLRNKSEEVKAYCFSFSRKYKLKIT
jgi:hypothetical protein